MKKTVLSALALLTAALALSIPSIAADSQYRFMHNDHDTLIIGEITYLDDERLEIKAHDYIVSADNMRQDGKAQLRPEAVTILNPDPDYVGEKSAGDYVIASLDKNGEHFGVAWGLFAVDSLDYATLKVTAYTPMVSAMLTDFVNSGGVYNDFFGSGQNLFRRYNGEETLIYPLPQASEAATESAPPETTRPATAAELPATAAPVSAAEELAEEPLDFRIAFVCAAAVLLVAVPYAFRRRRRR